MIITSSTYVNYFCSACGTITSRKISAFACHYSDPTVITCRECGCTSVTISCGGYNKFMVLKINTLDNEYTSKIKLDTFWNARDLDVNLPLNSETFLTVGEKTPSIERLRRCMYDKFSVEEKMIYVIKIAQRLFDDEKFECGCKKPSIRFDVSNGIMFNVSCSNCGASLQVSVLDFENVRRTFSKKIIRLTDDSKLK